MAIRRALIAVAPSDRGYAAALVDALKITQAEILVPAWLAEAMRADGVDAPVTPIGSPADDPFTARARLLDPQIVAGLGARTDAESFGVAPIDLLAITIPQPPSADAPRAEMEASLDVAAAALVHAAVRGDRATILPEAKEYGAAMAVYWQAGEFPSTLRRANARKALTMVLRAQAAFVEREQSMDDEGRPIVPAVYAPVYERIAEFSGADVPAGGASFYGRWDAKSGTLPRVMLLGGGDVIEPSYAQTLDAALGLELLAGLPLESAAIVARRTPLVVVTAKSGDAAASAVFERGKEISPASVLVLGSHASTDAVRHVDGTPIRCVVAPSFDPDAMAWLRAREQTIVLASGDLPAKAALEPPFVQVPSGIVRGAPASSARDLLRGARVASARQPTAEESAALELAWATLQCCRADAIVVARASEAGAHTVAVVSSALSRWQALDVALARAGAEATGAVVACDSTFASPAEIGLLMERGVVAAAHPGGPRDAEIVAAGSHVLVLLATGARPLRYA